MTEEEVRYDERKRCARILCPHCAARRPRDEHGDHILETIQGHVSWSQACPAFVLFRDGDPA